MIFYIRKMTGPPTSYFKYFPASDEIRRWGLAVTAAGCTRFDRNAAYPHPGHPVDHQFDWRRGRRLERIQIVLISSGRGWFESENTGCSLIEAGTAFAVIPQIWHRYKPDSETGWEESWVELRGYVPDQLLKDSVFSKNSSLILPSRTEDLKAALDQVHRIARFTKSTFDPSLAAAGLSVAAAWHRAQFSQPARDHLNQVILEAERRLVNDLEGSIDLREMARALGLSYSHFRRAFREQTGYAPWQFLTQQRLLRARALLKASDATMDEIANRVGFSSSFHFSATFKKAYGIAPSIWRRSEAKIVATARAQSGFRAE
jgi:AraC-like DNA-binding protein